MANKFFVAPSPHVHSAQSTRSIMRDVLIAMLPALAVSTWVHGVDVLTVSAIAVVSCVVIEFLIQKFLFHGECTVSNLSAAVTGLLLAFNLPSSIPWWIVVIGSLVAIGVAKMTLRHPSSRVMPTLCRVQRRWPQSRPVFRLRMSIC